MVMVALILLDSNVHVHVEYLFVNQKKLCGLSNIYNNLVESPGTCNKKKNSRTRKKADNAVP